MKFLVALTLCLVLSTSVQGSFFDDLKTTLSGVGTAFKTTFSGVVDQGKQLGTQLLGQLKEQGTQLLGQAAQSLLLNVMNTMSKQQSAPTRRDLPDLVNKAQKVVEEVKQELNTGVESISGLFHSALTVLQNLGSNLEPLSTKEIETQVKNVVSTHKHLLEGIIKNIVQSVSQKLTAAASQLNNKREHHDVFSQVQSGLTDFLHSHTDLLHQVVSSVGQSLTDTAGQMQGSVDQSLSHLGQELLGHLSHLGHHGDNLVQHGSHALDALKQMLATAMHQTATDVQAPES